MGPFGVAQGWQILFCVGKDLPLVDPAELGVAAEVFFVQGLEPRVEQTRQQRVGNL